MDRKRKKKKRTEKKGGKRKEKTRGKHSGLRLWCFSYFLVGWKCDCQSSQRRLAASSDCVLAAGAGYCSGCGVLSAGCCGGGPWVWVGSECSFLQGMWVCGYMVDVYRLFRGRVYGFSAHCQSCSATFVDGWTVQTWLLW